MHRAAGPYPGIINKETDAGRPPVLPLGPYRPPSGKTVPLSLNAASAGRAPAPNPLAGPADDRNLAITTNIDLTTNGLGASTADQEASVATAGNLIFYTSNWRAEYSTDDGNVWTALNPATTFPSAAGGFCCDQVVQYVPSVNRVFWILQYGNDANGEDVIRVAWASPSAIAADAVHAWTYVDLSSRSLLGAGKCFDQPHVGTARDYLYLNIDQCVGGSVYNSSLMRLTLADVDHSSMFVEWAVLSPFKARVARTMSSTGYFVGALNTSTLRVFEWKARSSTITWKDVGVPSIAQSNWTSKTPGGVDWLTRMQNSQGTGVTGVTTYDGKVWAAWAAGRDYKDGSGTSHSRHSQPVIESSQISLDSDGAASSTHSVTFYNNDFAVSQPDFATNDRGEVGLSFEWGGNGKYYANHGVGIVTGAPRFATDVAGSTDNDPSPCASPCVGDPAGDYTTVNVDYPDTSCWISAGVAHQQVGTPPAANSKPHYSVFGRAGTSCAPPPRFRTITTTTLTCPGQVTPGSPVTASGTLSPAQPGAQITVTFTRPDGSTVSQTVGTDGGGNFSATQASGGQSGDWRMAASYAGSADALGSQSVSCATYVQPTPPPGKLSSSITVNCPASQRAGANTTFSGTISPARAGTVTVTYTPIDPGTPYKPYTSTAAADATTGAYSDTVSLAEGSWSVQASWPGDAQYNGATSNSCTYYAQPVIR